MKTADAAKLVCPIKGIATPYGEPTRCSANGYTIKEPHLMSDDTVQFRETTVPGCMFWNEYSEDDPTAEKDEGCCALMAACLSTF